MKLERQIDEIITKALPVISNGEETIESIVGKHPQIEAELRPRLEAALWLQQTRFAFATRPGYIHDSRRYLESKIESMPLNSLQQLLRRYSPQRWAFNLAAPVIILLLLMLIVNSAALTARLSIPGQALYPTKLVLEDLKMAFTFDVVERTDLHIQFSRERTLEFVELVMEGDYERLPLAAERMETEVISALHSLDRMPAENPSAEQAMITNFKDTLSNHILMLNVLKSTSPSTAHQGIEMAISVAQSGLMVLR
jgi:hypothetical protein